MTCGEARHVAVIVVAVLVLHVSMSVPVSNLTHCSGGFAKLNIPDLVSSRVCALPHFVSGNSITSTCSNDTIYLSSRDGTLRDVKRFNL